MLKQARHERYHYWLAAAALFAPLLGGQLSLDPLPVPPGEVLAAIFREPPGAPLAHALIFAPLAIGLLFALSRRAVLQLPHPRVVLPWVVFALLLLASVGMSSYKFASVGATAEWCAYLCAMFATVTLVGRGQGPKVVSAAIALGVTVVALLGIREYAQQPDPTWRIMANWLNPNALAALLVIGVFCGLGTFSRSESNRLGSIGSLTAAIICSIGLFLTGSKGGLLSLAVGGVVYILYHAAANSGGRIRGLMLLVPTVLVGALLANLLVSFHHTPSGQAGASAFSRVANAGASQEQSAGFRRLLWQSSIALVKDNPLGRGIGTFRYHSAKPGLVTGTQLAHQSYLQLAVEGGVVALVAFLAALFLSGIDVLRASRSLPDTSLTLRAGLLSAMFAVGAHSMVDSDFSSFGIGFLFFVLLGTSLQLAGDGTVPEFTPKGVRGFAGFISLATLSAMVYFGLVDLRLGAFRYALGANDAPEAVSQFEALASLASVDTRVWALGARATQSMDERVSRLRRAVALGPTPALHRQLAQIYAQQNDATSAERELRASLTLDPNNLYSLRQLLDLSIQVGDGKANEIARQLVALEDTPYFRVRSIPEIIPTETYEARQYLANGLQGAERAQMLLPAMEGYAAYANTTVPPVVTFAKGGLDGSFGGVTAAEAIATLQRGIQVCSEVAESDQSLRGRAEDSAAIMRNALADLGGTTTP